MTGDCYHQLAGNKEKGCPLQYKNFLVKSNSCIPPCREESLRPW